MQTSNYFVFSFTSGLFGEPLAAYATDVIDFLNSNARDGNNAMSYHMFDLVG